MSVPVALTDLEGALAGYPWGYFVSVNAEPRAHMRAVPTRFVGGVLLARVGAGTLVNVAARPSVTMVFPPSEPGAFSLIVDGTAEVRGDEVALHPTSAVLHQPAIRPD